MLDISIEEFDKLKIKILKYIYYKKRTEEEIKQKFSEYNDEILSDIIEELKETGYINDFNYIEKQISEFMKLKTLSIKEIKYKLTQKGIDKELIEDYADKNKRLLEEYEKNSIEKIIIKKSVNMDEEQIRNYLERRGFKNFTN